MAGWQSKDRAGIHRAGDWSAPEGPGDIGAEMPEDVSDLAFHKCIVPVGPLVDHSIFQALCGAWNKVGLNTWHAMPSSMLGSFPQLPRVSWSYCVLPK